VAAVWFVGAPLTFAADDDALVPPDADAVAIGQRDRHVTLVFLGRLPEEVALEVWRALPALHLPATVRALRWDRFGRSALALELSDDDGLLAAAADCCHDAAAQVVDLQGHPVDRPHVTMARVPRRARPPSARTLAAWPLPSHPLAVGAPTLYRTHPQRAPDGDRYALVAQQPTDRRG
jgi:2'-5' RNA ligase